MSLSSSSENNLDEIYYKIIKSIGKTKHGELFLVSFDGIDKEYIKKEKKRKKNELEKQEKKKKEKEDEIKAYEEKKIEIKDIFIPKQTIEKGKFYDIIIKMDLLNELIVNGWEIYFSEEGKKNYEKYKKENIITVSVMGESNRGKSFLLEKICNIEVPKGFTEKTEGISVKYFVTDQLKCALIDTAGGQTPLIKNEKYNKYFKIFFQNILINDVTKEVEKKMKNEKDENVKEELNKKIEEIKKIENIDELKQNNENVYYRALKYLILDKSITEQIIKDYILNKSRIIFVVIGQLTINEQLLINNLKIDNNYDEIIIIHNLLNFVKISQVKNYINDVLKKSIYFDLKEMSMIEIDGSLNKNQNNIYFIEKLNNDNNSQTIRHLIIANDSKQSEAGKYYNYSCINYLRNILVSVSNPKKFDIIEELKDFISEKSFNYIEKEKSDNKIPIEKDNFEIINDNNNNLKLVLKNINNLKLKRLVADESGNFKYFGNAFSPSFTYYKEFLNDIECFVIAIELAGKIKKLRQKISLMNNGKYFISITGIKELPFIHKNYLNYSDIDEDEFRIEFEINTDEYELKNPKYIKNIQSDGIIKLYYEIPNKNENSNEIVFEEKNNDKKKKKKKKNKEEKE